MRVPSSHSLCVTSKSPNGGSKREFLQLVLPLNLVCGLNIASLSL